VSRLDFAFLASFAVLLFVVATIRPKRWTVSNSDFRHSFNVFLPSMLSFDPMHSSLGFFLSLRIFQRQTTNLLLTWTFFTELCLFQKWRSSLPRLVSFEPQLLTHAPSLFVRNNLKLPKQIETHPLAFPIWPQNFLALLESSTGMTFSDLCLRVGPDQREFPCHRVILATRSRWFNSMLLNGMQESNLRSISLPDTDPSIFEHVMRWIYSGSVDINALLAPEEASAVGTRLWKLWEARLLFT
jgi:hypothetical protein